MTPRIQGRRALAAAVAISLFLIGSALAPPAVAQHAARQDAKGTHTSRPQLPPAHAEEGETQGVVWTGDPGITETVAGIMERERLVPKVDASAEPQPSKPEIEYRRLHPLDDPPSAPAVSRWPMRGPARSVPRPYNPQTVGTSFLGAQLSESGFIPPDSIGDVGPTQILVAVNGRIKIFDKAGNLGGLNTSTNTFFNSVRNGVGVSDPHVRYDRLSGRWFITIINVPAQGPNRVLIAMSSGSTITGTSSFTFFQFQQDFGAFNSDTNGFADYDTLGVDKFALYLGVNMFDQTGTSFLGTSGFVVNKANLIANTLTVTAFRQMAGNACPGGAGPTSPQGVSTDDPSATEGYFIGPDLCFFSRLQIRRVGNPGGSPTLSGNLTVSVPKTRLPIDQVQPGTPVTLDALDDRLFAAAIHNNKITGVSTLWTAHNIQVDTGGVACGPPDPSPCSGGGRNGSRWYQIGNLTGTPALLQSDTVFDSASTNPLGYWIPSVAMSGQGHMAIGTSRAGASAANGFASIAVAGRLRTDTSDTTQAPTLAQPSSTAYLVQAANNQRWGDYSQTVVDPTNDQTLWTFQEYCLASNSWGVRAIQLMAPPPATPSSANPSSLACGQASVSVAVTGTSSGGSEFFDPGPDTGGPGFQNHIAGAITGGVAVNSATFVDPTHVTLNLSTVGASVGTKSVTITNPDGQQATGSNILTVGTAPPVASNNGPICAGQTLQITATGPAGSYSWTGPNGFTSTLQNPQIPSATVAANGTYSVTVTAGGCASAPATTTASVTAPPTATVSGDTTICQGASTTVQAALTGLGPWNLTWSPDNLMQSPSSSPAIRTVTPAQTTTYQVSAVSNAVCGSGTSSGSATVTIDGGVDCGSFVTVTPCRLVDTRSGQGPALAANTTRSFDVRGLCGVPLDAKAVAITLAAVDETNVGNLRLYPAGAVAPFASTINFIPSTVRTNNAIIPLGSSGQISVLCTMTSGSTNFVMDVTGYFK